jgi:hypothetical protein
LISCALKFQASDVPFLRLGTSTDKVEGEKVIVIGNPTGLTGSVSDGIISAFREGRSLIQVTAPISPGSSGSPAMDEDGQVIGVATTSLVEGQNLNFAIAIEQVSAALNAEHVAQTSPTLEPPKPSPTPFALGPSYDPLMPVIDKAISDYNDAISLGGNSATRSNLAIYYENRGNAYLRIGNRSKANADFATARRLKSGH